jgi:ribosomal protein S18 acetylase RimI-like enzyme
MCVDEDFRGQRIATSLVRAGEKVAIKWGFNLTTLHVYEENDAALRAYERCGYKVLERPFRTPYDVVKNQRKLLMAKRVR